MRKEFEEFFENEGITQYGEISAKDLVVIAPHIMPENIKSALFWLIPYNTGKHPDRNISLYSVSKDYHLYSAMLRERFNAYASKLFPEEKFYLFCDSSPVNEIDGAIKAGLGVLGENRLLINERYGSFVFVGSVLATLEAHSPISMPKRDCIKCGKCKSICDFLSGKSAVCTSELNQRKKVSQQELEYILSKKIRWGCDECQEICPMNKNVEETPIDFFKEDIIEKLSVELVEGMTKEEFKKRAFAWRGRNTILRNLGEKI